MEIIMLIVSIILYWKPLDSKAVSEYIDWTVMVVREVTGDSRPRPGFERN